MRPVKTQWRGLFFSIWNVQILYIIIKALEYFNDFIYIFFFIKYNIVSSEEHIFASFFSDLNVTLWYQILQIWRIFWQVCEMFRSQPPIFGKREELAMDKHCCKTDYCNIFWGMSVWNKLYLNTLYYLQTFNYEWHGLYLFEIWLRCVYSSKNRASKYIQTWNPLIHLIHTQQQRQQQPQLPGQRKPQQRQLQRQHQECRYLLSR